MGIEGSLSTGMVSEGIATTCTSSSKDNNFGALLGSVAVNDVPSLRVKAQSITKKSSQS